MRRLLIAAALATLALGAVGYVLFLRGPDDDAGGDPLAYERRLCGDGDALHGAQLEHCVELALDLMGREPAVAIDDVRARALLARSCDQAFERACYFLTEYDATRVDFAQWRCEGRGPARDGRPPQRDPRACTAVGRAYEDGVGRDRRWLDARRWYEQACTLGDTEGCARKERVVPQ